MSDLLVFPGGGRLRSVDKRDLDHLLPPPRSAVGAPTTKVYQHWYAPKALDQGRSSSCVGHGCHQLLRAAPVLNKKDIPSPYQIYNEAQLIDEWPGAEPTYYGTSVRAGIKVLARLGYISSYRWAFDAATAVNHILNVGPMVIGVDWREGMMAVDDHGYVYNKGRLIGGHCVILVGTNVAAKNPDGTKGFCTILNSWGTGWANKGRAKISISALDELIRDQGEAAAVFETLKPTEAPVVS
jgi:hypothetical protein